MSEPRLNHKVNAGQVAQPAADLARADVSIRRYLHLCCVGKEPQRRVDLAGVQRSLQAPGQRSRLGGLATRLRLGLRYQRGETQWDPCRWSLAGSGGRG